MIRACARIIAHAGVLSLLAVLSLAFAMTLDDDGLSQIFLAVTSVLGATLTLAFLGRRLHVMAAGRRAAAIRDLVARDITPAILSDADGEVTFCNPAAVARFAPQGGQTLQWLFRGVLANPGPLLFRLQAKATAQGAARDDVVIRGGHLRLAVTRLDGGAFLWRAEDIASRSPATRGMTGTDIAMLTVGRGGAILSMNDAARCLIGERVKSLDRLCTDLPFRQLCRRQGAGLFDPHRGPLYPAVLQARPRQPFGEGFHQPHMSLCGDGARGVGHGFIVDGVAQPLDGAWR